MTVRFYNAFSKRKNSTKKPANTDTHYDINVVLKEDTTIERPSLVLTNPEGAASGNPVTVSALGGNMVSPSVTFNPIQTGSGTPSPSNPRPIVGYGDIQVTVNGNTTVIDIDGVKYGGVLDVSTGVLIINWVEIDLGAYNYAYANFGANSYFIATIPTSSYTTPLCLSDIYKYVDALGSTDTNGNYVIRIVNNNNLRIRNLDYTDPALFKSAMRGHKVYIDVGTNALQIQLTPAQIALAHGSNVVAVNGNSTISFGYTAEEIATDYVYAYIPKWDKYYFVATPNILTNYHVQYDLEEDYLASRKTEVGSTVAHIAYSSTGWDKDLTDSRCAVKGTKTIYHDSQALPFVTAGCYIVGIVNNQTDGKLGALSYYRMDAINLAKLITWMMKDDFFTKISSYFNGKPLDFIQSCIWCPVNGADFGNTLQTTMYLGDTAVADYSTVPETAVLISHYPITTPIKAYPVVSVSLGSKFNDFRDAQPYTSASLYLPGVGLTDLNANDFYESANVNIETIFDITTGDCTYKIYDDTNQLLKTVSFNASASVSLSQVNINSAGALAGIGGAVGGVVGLGVAAVTMNPLAGVTAGVGILGGASAAIMAANQRSTSIKGTNSGRSGFYTNSASSVVVRQDTEDCDDASYIARIGRPVGKTHAISNHSGYVQCEAASVALAGDNTEREIINNYLNTGFFYE